MITRTGVVVFVSAAALLIPAAPSGPISSAAAPSALASVAPANPTVRAGSLKSPRLTVKRLASKKIRATARVKARKVEFSWTQKSSSRTRSRVINVRSGKASVVLPAKTKKVKARARSGRNGNTVSPWTEVAVPAVGSAGKGRGPSGGGVHVIDNRPPNLTDNDPSNDRDHLYNGNLELQIACETVNTTGSGQQLEVQWNDGSTGDGGLLFPPIKGRTIETAGEVGPDRESFVVRRGEAHEKFMRFQRVPGIRWNGNEWISSPYTNIWYTPVGLAPRADAGCPG